MFLLYNISYCVVCIFQAWSLAVPFSTFTHLEDPFVIGALRPMPVPFKLHHKLLDLSVPEQLSTTQLMAVKNRKRAFQDWDGVAVCLTWAQSSTGPHLSWILVRTRGPMCNKRTWLCPQLRRSDGWQRTGQDSEGEKLLVILVLVLLIASNGPTRCPNARASA